MAFSKANRYNIREQRIARTAKALAHPARIQILNQLKCGELSFQEILAFHPIKRAALSDHLRSLRLASLIGYSIREDKYVYHSLFENHPEWLEVILKRLPVPDYEVIAA